MQRTAHNFTGSHLSPVRPFPVVAEHLPEVTTTTAQLVSSRVAECNPPHALSANRSRRSNGNDTGTIAAGRDADGDVAMFPDPDIERTKTNFAAHRTDNDGGRRGLSCRSPADGAGWGGGEGGRLIPMHGISLEQMHEQERTVAHSSMDDDMHVDVGGLHAALSRVSSFSDANVIVQSTNYITASHAWATFDQSARASGDDAVEAPAPNPSGLSFQLLPHTGTDSKRSTAASLLHTPESTSALVRESANLAISGPSRVLHHPMQHRDLNSPAHQPSRTGGEVDEYAEITSQKRIASPLVSCPNIPRSVPMSISKPLSPAAAAELELET